MKAEQNAWSLMGMPRITKLGQLDPFIAGGNELISTTAEDLTFRDVYDETQRRTLILNNGEGSENR